MSRASLLYEPSHPRHHAVPHGFEQNEIVHSTVAVFRPAADSGNNKRVICAGRLLRIGVDGVKGKADFNR